MNLRILIVAEHASAQFGGEAALPLHYYRLLRSRRIPVWLLVHDRIRPELQALFPDDRDQIVYVPDTTWHLLLNRFGKFLPERLWPFTIGFCMGILTQLAQRRIIRQLVKQHQINVIHQPIPVSPKQPSMIFGMGAPVVIGPMNGGMDYPPGFQQKHSRVVDFTVYLGRQFANLLNWMIPGKRQASALLVANQRTRKALPAGVSKHVIELVENGVDAELWSSNSPVYAKSPSSAVHCVFVGRLVDWKAVDLLLLAFKQALSQVPISLTIIGDGKERENLMQQAQALEILGTEIRQPGQVYFAGWLTQTDCASYLNQSDIFVLPSLLECGGAVVLEAMMLGLPVIAAKWGGPADYLDSSCGILIEPRSQQQFVEELSQALITLAQHPQLREAMGQIGQNKARQEFDWDVKIDRVLTIYQKVVAGNLQPSRSRKYYSKSV